MQLVVCDWVHSTGDGYLVSDYQGMGIDFRQPSYINEAAIDVDNFRDRHCYYNPRNVEVRFISKISRDNLNQYFKFKL